MQIKSFDKDALKNFEADAAKWLTDQATTHGLTYLLAHADDGVIWGRLEIENGHLLTSGEVFKAITVELRVVTLQQARLFGDKGEVLVWRTDDGFAGRYLTDDGSEETIEETHLLWGEASDPPGPQQGFTLMRDGQQGLLHAPPIVLRRGQRAGLRVRHYLAYDEQGQAYIALSRLVVVQAWEK